jgi:hypothetical protein
MDWRTALGSLWLITVLALYLRAMVQGLGG